MGRAQIALNAATFLYEIGPDLYRAGRALYKVFKGDVGRTRSVLEILPDYAKQLLEDRAQVDRALAELRASRQGPES